MGLFDKFLKKLPEQDTVEWTVTLTDPQPDPQPKKAAAPVAYDNHYEFIIKSEDEKTDRAIVRYQKFWTDPEDKYEGMTLMQFKEEGYPGDKIYQYPPLDVAVKLDAFLGEDGSVEISGFIDDGNKYIYVGKAAKTKAKKILRINRVYIGEPFYMKPEGKRATTEDYERFTAELMDRIYDCGDGQ